jgi:hypothetical protein
METEGRYDCATCGESLNIVGILRHDCDRVLSAANITTGEQDTLLYVETRVVDHGGVLDLWQMNYDDQQHLKLFGAAGILDVAEDRNPYEEAMCVEAFTERAWDLVGECRWLRAARNMDGDVVDAEALADRLGVETVGE